MPEPSIARGAAALLLAGTLFATGAAQAQERASRHLAPGFSSRPAASKLVILPAEMELFSISAGGVVEPRADWTEAAQKHFAAALTARKGRMGEHVTTLAKADTEEFAEILALHRAVADSIFIHHAGGRIELPTKQGRLDWSLGDAVKPLQERTGADYALFTWMRDSYASGERKVALFAMALLGAIPIGGEQVGYASLVDLRTGRVVWFNDMNRFWGDLREGPAAADTVDALLKNFPEVK